MNNELKTIIKDELIKLNFGKPESISEIIGTPNSSEKENKGKFIIKIDNKLPTFNVLLDPLYNYFNDYYTKLNKKEPLDRKSVV